MPDPGVASPVARDASPVRARDASLALCATQLLTAVRDDDLSLAYWLARVIEHAGASPPLPASGLAAALLSNAMREPEDADPCSTTDAPSTRSQPTRVTLPR